MKPQVRVHHLSQLIKEEFQTKNKMISKDWQLNIRIIKKINLKKLMRKIMIIEIVYYFNLGYKDININKNNQWKE